MKLCCQLILIAALVAVTAPASGQTPTGSPVGRPAFTLHVAEWVKGDPVNLEHGRDKNIYVLEFCNSRNLSTDGLGVRLRAEQNPEKKLFTPIRTEISLPTGFPDKYRKATLKTANLCSVKKHIVTPPDFEVVLTDSIRL